MKGTIFEIKRLAIHDGDGIRTTVFFKGCPLKCVWCHNPEGLSRPAQLAYYADKCIGCMQCVDLCPAGAHRQVEGRHEFDPGRCTACGRCADGCLGQALTLFGREVTVEEVLDALLEDREFYESSGGGITLSGGECLLQADFCAALLKQCKANGLHTAVDTCGFVSREALDKVIPYTDVFLYDVKAVDQDVHLRCTGMGSEPVLDNLRYLDRRGCQLRIRIPYVPGWNDDQMERIRAVLAPLHHVQEVRVLGYHNYAGSKYRALGMENTLPDTLPTPQELDRARSVFDGLGIPVC